MMKFAGSVNTNDLGWATQLNPTNMKTQHSTCKPVISLTTFVDYISKAGSPKLTVVRNAVAKYGEYDPRTDFWKSLREGIVEYHQNGVADKSTLDALAANQYHEPKKKAYPNAVAGYKKFLGRKEIEWFEPEKTIWETTDLIINVNPELGLVINGRPTILKLYFCKESITKDKANLIRLLMLEAMKESHPGTPVGLLDVQKNKLYDEGQVPRELIPLLVSEAASFASLWRSLVPANPVVPDPGEATFEDQVSAA